MKTLGWHLQISHISCNFVSISVEIPSKLWPIAIYTYLRQALPRVVIHRTQVAKKTVQPYEGEPRASNEDFDEDWLTRLSHSYTKFVFYIFFPQYLLLIGHLETFFYKKADKNSLKANGLLVILFHTCIKGNLLFRNHKWNLNPSTPKISLVILVTNCHINLMMRVWRIWYWINW